MLDTAQMSRFGVLSMSSMSRDLETRTQKAQLCCSRLTRYRSTAECFFQGVGALPNLAFHFSRAMRAYSTFFKVHRYSSTPLHSVINVKALYRQGSTNVPPFLPQIIVTLLCLSTTPICHAQLVPGALTDTPLGATACLTAGTGDFT